MEVGVIAVLRNISASSFILKVDIAVPVNLGPETSYESSL
jgi:hypothetical protein